PAQDWFALDVDIANNVLSVGASPVALPTTGDVTAFGIFSESKGDSHRYDNYNIQGSLIPEPGSLSLLAVGATTLMRRRR
ncbi:PEP-CTERM sorting domain-containing protein, partial [Bacillus sp. SIMBA_161]